MNNLVAYEPSAGFDKEFLFNSFLEILSVTKQVFKAISYTLCYKIFFGCKDTNKNRGNHIWVSCEAAFCQVKAKVRQHGRQHNLFWLTFLCPPWVEKELTLSNRQPCSPPGTSLEPDMSAYTSVNCEGTKTIPQHGLEKSEHICDASTFFFSCIYF